MDSQDALTLIKKGVEEILVYEELVELLKSKKTLSIKAGFDPTAPDLHIGHVMLLNKMRQFQKLGHQIFFLIGDFTGMIGDPTGKNVARKPLTQEEIQENAKTYKAQVFKVLDPDKTRIVFNSSWMNNLQSQEIIKLASKYTVARMLERDDFHKRYISGESIAIHEFLYPLMQGYDSVVMKTDIELGGTDQKFNLLVGRELQKHYGQKPQVVITLPLLEGLDGVQKMSKSLGNYIGIDEPPKEIFGKVMSISDDLMWRYFELISEKTLMEINKLKHSVTGGANPRDIKFLLAEEIVTRFHSKEDAMQAKQAFIEQFSQGIIPDDIDKVTISAGNNGQIPLANLLKLAGLVTSITEGNRMIQQGAVRIDGNKIEDKDTIITVGSKHIFQVGKRRFAKIKVEK